MEVIFNLTNDPIPDNFSLNEECEIATCDHCGKTFDVNKGYWRLEDHYISCLARLKD